MATPRSPLVDYDPPVSIFSQRTPLQCHISLEPLPAFAATFGSAVRARAFPTGPAVPDPWDTVYNSDTCKNSGLKRPGRRVSNINITLRLFMRSDPAHMDKPPKLENIRYRVMRTLKKTLRRIFERKLIKWRGLLEMERGNEIVEKRLLEFKQFARNHRSVLLDFSQLVNGPRVDQSRHPGDTTFSTYNNSYMEYVFQTPEVRAIYQLFVQLIYSEPSSASLSRRFSIRCCSGPNHDSDCTASWDSFRKLLEGYMGTRIGEGSR